MRFLDWLLKREIAAVARSARRGVSGNKYDPPQCRGYRQERMSVPMGMSGRTSGRQRNPGRGVMPRPARTNALYLAQFPKDATR